MKLVKKTIEVPQYEVGDKVRVIKSPAMYEKYFKRGDYAGIQTVLKVSESSIHVSDKCNCHVVILLDELDCIEYVEPQSLPKLYLDDSSSMEKNISLNSDHSDELVTLSLYMDELTLDVWNIEGYELIPRDTISGVASFTLKAK